MMNYRLLCLVFMFGLAGGLKSQTVSILIDAGVLKGSDKTTVVPNGALLQLIASPSNTFVAPAPGSFVGGDNFVVSTFTMNSNSGTAGDTTNNTGTLTLTPTFFSGEALLLRFYPGLTPASGASTVVSGTAYGQVRSDSIEFGPTSSTPDPAEKPWVVPAGGSTTAHLNYDTISAGGTYPEGRNGISDGVIISSFADLTVVPEPSTYVGGLMGCAVIAYTVFRSRRAAPGQV